MKSLLSIVTIVTLSTTGLFAEEWTPLFDGKTLDGWRGDSALWSVKDGTIIGEITAEKPIDHNTFLVSEKSYEDFEIKFTYRIIGGNSGLQYRSKLVDADKFIVHGYQADIEAGQTYTGILYEEGGRGILANRGKKVEATEDGTLKELATLGDSAEIQEKILSEDWNEYHITVKGNHMIHRINGTITAEFIDNQEEHRANSGILAFQLHVGPPMKVELKKIFLRKL